jgi:hypothetical protein
MDDMDLEAKQISYWRFAADMLGPKYLLLLTVSTIVAVWLVVRATNRARANTSASLLGLTILLPCGVGIYSLLDGFMLCFMKVLNTDAPFRTSEISQGVVQCLMGPLWGLLLSAIPFAVAHIRLANIGSGIVRQVTSGERSDAADSR